MSLDQDYDEDNIFAKIIAGVMPCVKLAETDRTLAFMDIFPQSRGHCLVISKTARATNLLDADDQTLSDIMCETRRVAAAVRTALAPDGIRVVQFNGAPAGQTVFHLHMHIMPVFEGETLNAHGQGAPADTAELEAIAAQIRPALG